MAKPTHPLLSLGAQGTLGNALTFQRTGGQQISRRKPHPRQPNTLEQWYQRWLYQNYIAYWHSLSAAEKETYRAAATLQKLPVFPYFLSFHLKNLPDVAGQWHFDNIIGGLTPDSSKNANNATVNGPVLTPGLIGNCLSFDGTDDWINCGIDPSLDITDAVSVIMRFKPNSATAMTGRYLMDKNNNYMFFGHAADRMRWFMRYSDGTTQFVLWDNIAFDVWHTIIGTYDKDAGPANLRVYGDGVIQNTATNTRALLESPGTRLTIGRGLPALSVHGLYDEIIVLNRALSDTEAKLYSERRYPPQ